jgi:ABC-type molybdate transport system substrate-binding protein
MGRALVLLLVAAAALAAAGCGRTAVGPAAAGASATRPPSGELLIAADDSMAAAFGAVKPAYEAATPGAKLTFTFGASSALRAKIERGQPTDLFFSADVANAQAIVTDRLAAGPAAPFAVTPAGGTSSFVILARSADVLGSAAFVRWLAGPDGQAILKGFGFASPPPP